MGNKIVPLDSILIFNEEANNRTIEDARRFLNRGRSTAFLVIGVRESGEDFSIHCSLQEKELRYFLEKVIRSLPDGKQVVSLD